MGLVLQLPDCSPSRDYDVVIHYKNDAVSAENLVSECLLLGVRAVAIQADISIEQDVVRLFEQVDCAFGAVAALVNNAGVLLPQMSVDEMSAERINQVLITNVTGYFLCCREAVRRMAFKYNGSGGTI